MSPELEDRPDVDGSMPPASPRPLESDPGAGDDPDQPEKRSTEAKRLSVSLRARDVSLLADVTEAEGISANEAIRQAIQVDSFIREARRKHRKILIEDEDGNFREVTFVM